LAYDPILAKCKLIAEAWDAGGLYQVGSFPSFGRWAEWNGKYRDMLRQFVKGDAEVWEMSHRLMGSPDLYAEGNRPPTTSINFITAHDGFTLLDLFSYDEKHNEANGEGNRDGANDNFSWNCGVEGVTDDPEINALRRRLVQNAIALLMVSQGVPMILMGDEMGRTKQGNNNTYCHDNELNWLDWSLLERNQDIFEFFQHCIAFRHAHPVLRRSTHFHHQDLVGSGYADISWHGTQAWNVDWADYSRTLAFLLCGQHAKDGEEEDDYIYVGMNMHWEALTFEIPQLPDDKQWHLFADTGLTSAQKSWKPGTEAVLENQFEQKLCDRSVLILVGR
jgi:glycogen operon protein